MAAWASGTWASGAWVNGAWVGGTSGGLLDCWAPGAWVVGCWEDGTWGETDAPPTPDAESRTPGGSGYPVYWQGKRRKRRLEDQPNLHLKKVLDDVVNELYGELTEDDVPAAVQAKAAKLVKPFVAKKSKTLAIPPVTAVDWVALEKDATRVRQLIALWRKQEEDVEIEAEDEYLLMMS